MDLEELHLWVLWLWGKRVTILITWPKTSQRPTTCSKTVTASQPIRQSNSRRSYANITLPERVKSTEHRFRVLDLRQFEKSVTAEKILATMFLSDTKSALFELAGLVCGCGFPSQIWWACLRVIWKAQENSPPLIMKRAHMHIFSVGSPMILELHRWHFLDTDLSFVNSAVVFRCCEYAVRTFR